VRVAVLVCGTHKTYTLYLRKGKLGVILKLGVEGLTGVVEQVETKRNAMETCRLHISDKSEQTVKKGNVAGGKGDICIEVRWFFLECALGK